MPRQQSCSKMLQKAFKKDADLLAAIHQECFPNYWNISQFNNFFVVDGTRALLADAVGMMVYRLYPEEAEIITLAVLPTYRRQGLARRMLEHALKEAGEKGCKHIFLDVEDGNAAAISLYENHGFSQVRRRKLYYRKTDGTYTDALVMRRKLD